MEKRVSSAIAVTPERLRKIAAKMGTGAVEVTAILSTLAADVAPVRSEWAGAAQTQFNALWDELERDVSDLQSVLSGIARLTEKAAAAYEAAEERIAQSFDQFRVEGDVVFDEDGPIAADRDDADLSRAAPYPEEPPQSAVEDSVGVVEDSLASPVATEFEDDDLEEMGRSAGRPLGSVKPPWARFMPKEVLHSDVGKVMTDTRRRDRRFKTSDPSLEPGTRICQGCFTVVVIDPEHIETTATHTYFRCPNCGNSFPVRNSDIETSP
jgi:WXG100 family type VII secretion target